MEVIIQAEHYEEGRTHTETLVINFLRLFPDSPFLCDLRSKFSSVFDQSSLLQLPTVSSNPKDYDS